MGLLDVIRRSKGLFTKKGELVDYNEVHTFLLGAARGFGRSSLNKGYDKDADRVDYEMDWHYYRYGYLFGRRAKYLLGAGTAAGAAGVHFGVV